MLYVADDRQKEFAPAQIANTRDDFRSAMRQLATGLSVIATGSGAARAGLTASAVSSLSIDPPTLLVCIAKSASALPIIISRGNFSVNILRATQRDVAERFAGRDGLRGAERFVDADWTTWVTGAPVLKSALATIDCEVEEAIKRHTHVIVLGRVKAARASGNGAALLNWRGSFSSHTPFHAKDHA